MSQNYFLDKQQDRIVSVVLYKHLILYNYTFIDNGIKIPNNTITTSKIAGVTYENKHIGWPQLVGRCNLQMKHTMLK